MSQKSTAVELQDNSGNQVRAVSHESDYPLPPVAELEKLHQFRPDLVDKVFEMTKEEAKYRRERMLQIDRYLFLSELSFKYRCCFSRTYRFFGCYLSWFSRLRKDSDWTCLFNAWGCCVRN